MGLDMYLEVNREEEIYWRKANAIHGWFNNHLNDGRGVENCQYYNVDKSTLFKLLNDIDAVLSNNTRLTRQRVVRKRYETINLFTGQQADDLLAKLNCTLSTLVEQYNGLSIDDKDLYSAKGKLLISENNKPIYYYNDSLYVFCALIDDGFEVENNTLKRRKMKYGYVDKEVELELMEDTSKAQRFLPVTQGFFFGGYEYDEGYLEDLRYTRSKVKDLLERLKTEDKVEYVAWW